mmetsp:Transcript_23227/g.75543  ORF Transcript_23227/g.75543 Transcript_23227/m.75543 type:complete len:220 (-) Transcript_23227:99-758(-)
MPVDVAGGSVEPARVPAARQAQRSPAPHLPPGPERVDSHHRPPHPLRQLMPLPLQPCEAVHHLPVRRRSQAGVHLLPAEFGLEPVLHQHMQQGSDAVVEGQAGHNDGSSPCAPLQDALDRHLRSVPEAPPPSLRGAQEVLVPADVERWVVGQAREHDQVDEPKHDKDAGQEDKPPPSQHVARPRMLLNVLCTVQFIACSSSNTPKQKALDEQDESWLVS